MKIPTIIEYPDFSTSACSYWRSRTPFSYLEKQGKIKLLEGEYREGWEELHRADIAFFQRPMNRECLKQIAKAKDLGLKVWLDFDDYNHIPEYHPVYQIYKEIYDETSFVKMMLLADIVTVSTDYLNHYYSTYSLNIKTVPNALNDYWLKFRPISNKKIVFLRAGSHHEHDIYYYRDSIIRVMNQHSDWQLAVAGSNPIFLQQEILNYKYYGDLDIHNYFGLISTLKPSIFILPLMPNELNFSKSNIGWQEATFSGAVALCPEWMEIKEESMYYYNNKSFEENFTLLLDDQDLRKEIYEKAVSRIKQDFLLSNINKLRLEIIKDLLK